MSDQAFYEVKDVRHFDPAAKLTFTGTVKVHGTNTAVVIHPDGTYHCQSRSRIITPEDDNLGFAAWVAENEAEILHAATRIYGNLGVAGPYGRDFVLYGEFAGRGIQKGVAVNDTDRFFYVFAAAWRKDEDCEWVTVKALHMLKPESRPNVLFSGDALWMTIEIDFTHPETSQNSLVSRTNRVEEECPVGEIFGVSGVGEGIVWQHLTDDNQLLMFKVKGEKHSVTKVKKLAQVDPEKVASVAAFIEYAVTENRLQQGLQEACGGDVDRTKMGAFLKWVSSDVLKEESDVLSNNDLTMKDIGRAMSGRARAWFFEQEKLW